jgi:hypothetical protein
VVLRNVRGGIGGTSVVISRREDQADGSRAVQTHVGDADVCIQTHGEIGYSSDFTRIESIAAGGWVVMASKSGDRTMQLVLTPAAQGLDINWTVNGQRQTFGAEAAEWRDAIVPVLTSYLDVGAAARYADVYAVDARGAVIEARAGEVQKAAAEALAQTRRALQEASTVDQATRAQLDQQLAELKSRVEQALQARAGDTVVVTNLDLDGQLRRVTGDVVRYQVAVDSAMMIAGATPSYTYVGPDGQRIELRTRAETAAQLERATVAMKELEARQQQIQDALKAQVAAGNADAATLAQQKAELERVAGVTEQFRTGSQPFRISLSRADPSAADVERLMDAIRRVP